jgi:flagellar assembly factor FliW
VEVPDTALLVFPRGLFGYEEENRFALLDHRDNSPLRWLQALDNPNLAFVVIDPRLICPSYRFELNERDREDLGCGGGDALFPLAIVGIPESPEEMTANLKGPLVINTARRIGIQIIQSGDEYSAREGILSAVRRLHGRGRG